MTGWVAGSPKHAAATDEATVRDEVGAPRKATVDLEASEAALQITFATMSVVLDLHDRDPRLGSLLSDRLAVMAEGGSAGIVGLIGVEAQAVSERAGCSLTPIFAPS